MLVGHVYIMIFIAQSITQQKILKNVKKKKKKEERFNNKKLSLQLF